MRKLEELNLVDDFLFVSVLSYPGIGEAFARELLETVFERKFGKLTVVTQKAYYGDDTDKHGARLDVYIEEVEDWQAVSAVYDVEAQSTSRASQKDSLPKRVRFYHAKIDGGSLGSGEDYQALKTVVVIMLMPYDPFGQDQIIYTIKSCCVELPKMPYDDGARTIFLYTKGTQGNVSEELRQMLRYFENTTEENAKNENLKKMHRMVEEVRHNKEVSAEYMFWRDKVQQWKEEGKEEGRAEGREEGRAEGRAEGREEGRAEGRAEERRNTEMERQRKEEVLKENEKLKKELERLRAQLN